MFFITCHAHAQSSLLQVARPPPPTVDVEIIEDRAAPKRARVEQQAVAFHESNPSSGIIVQALALADAPPLLLDVTGRGPNDALCLLRASLPSDARGRLEWRRRARISAVLGSCPKARNSFRAGTFAFAFAPS